MSASNERARWPWVRILVLVYGGLWIASSLVRLGQPDHRPRTGQTVLTVQAVEGDSLLDRVVSLAYTDYRPPPPETKTGTPLLLLHGSPAASFSFNGLVRALPDSLRMIVPDLPGFGGSTLRIPDYSIRAHARYLLQLLNARQIDQVDVVAYSQGGGVVLELVNLAPERVRSVVLISSIGVQELELLGDYWLNHAVHAVQWGLIWLMQEGLPHFGWWDDAMLNTSYARNFYDTDQRPLRDRLLAYEGPMLILHGRTDGLVPVLAAREHARLVPQSRLVELEGGHELVFARPSVLVDPVVDFLADVERGSALRRNAADPQRMAAARRPFDPATRPEAEGIALFVIILLLATATLISEDLTCIGAGLLVAGGGIAFWPAVLACLIGIFGGDVLLFMIGRYVGSPVLRHPPLSWIVNERAVRVGQVWLRRQGPRVIVASRFIPGTRLPTYVGAGMLNMPFWRFAFYFLIASVIWTPILVGLAVIVGRELIAHFSAYSAYALPALLGTILVVWGVVKLALPLTTWRGRRMLVCRWRRLTRWEYWPPWVFYPPLLMYIGYLALRYRSMTLFTAANPAIEGGGFVGESKAAILDGLAAAGDTVASYAVIEPHPDARSRCEVVAAFREMYGGYPVVLKPDVGERGTDVAVVRSDAEVEAYFARHRARTIVQEYVPGVEFGVFYYRYPGEPAGRIFSVTDKQFPAVEGDGRRSLEHLILDDRRTVAMAPFYLDKLRDRLDEVPAPGRSVQLVELGTHCRGAFFFDGNGVRTQALEAAFDRISTSFEGFYFGRYDVRAASVEAFKEGRSFKILELNGVTSEATHIYDPQNSVRDAYRVLREQWRIAFEIGARNRDRGVRPMPLRDLIRSVRARWRRASDDPADA